jgi:hypothetical protein
MDRELQEQQDRGEHEPGVCKITGKKHKEKEKKQKIREKSKSHEEKCFYRSRRAGGGEERTWMSELRWADKSFRNRQKTRNGELLVEIHRPFPSLSLIPSFTHFSPCIL